MTTAQRATVLDLVSALARFGMAAVWIIAGIQKLDVRMEMAQAIEAYGIFTPEWSGYLAYLIGPLELMGGVLLLLGLFLREASAVAAVVLVLFMVSIAQAWARGLVIDCGCFGYEPRRRKPRHELRTDAASRRLLPHPHRVDDLAPVSSLRSPPVTC